MDAIQESELISLGNCQLHWHATDRAIDHSRILEMYRSMNTVTKSAAYAVTERDNYILVDQTCTITLPLAKNTNREVTVVLIAAGKTLTVAATSPDTIRGLGSISTGTQWTAYRFKAITGSWLII